MPYLILNLDQLNPYEDQDIIIGLARHYLTSEEKLNLTAGGQSHNAWVNRTLLKLKHKFANEREENP